YSPSITHVSCTGLVNTKLLCACCCDKVTISRALLTHIFTSSHSVSCKAVWVILRERRKALKKENSPPLGPVTRTTLRCALQSWPKCIRKCSIIESRKRN